MAELNWDKINETSAALDEKMNRSSAGAKFYKPSVGQNQIRILAGWAEKGEHSGVFWRQVAQHWRVSEDQKGPVLCPKETKFLEGPCPICDLVNSLKAKKGDMRAQEIVKDVRAKTTFLLNVVDMKDSIYTAADVAEYKSARPDGDVPFEVGSTKVQVYAAPSTVFNQVLNTIKLNTTDVTDPVKGHDVIVTKSGKGLQTKYQVTIVLKPSVAPEAKPVQLDQVGFVMDEDAMLELLTSGVGGDYLALLPSGPGEVTVDRSTAQADSDDGEDLRAQLQASMRSA